MSYHSFKLKKPLFCTEFWATRYLNNSLHIVTCLPANGSMRVYSLFDNGSSHHANDAAIATSAVYHSGKHFNCKFVYFCRSSLFLCVISSHKITAASQLSAILFSTRSLKLYGHFSNGRSLFWIEFF